MHSHVNCSTLLSTFNAGVFVCSFEPFDFGTKSIQSEICQVHSTWHSKFAMKSMASCSVCSVQCSTGFSTFTSYVHLISSVDDLSLKMRQSNEMLLKWKIFLSKILKETPTFFFFSKRSKVCLEHLWRMELNQIETNETKKKWNLLRNISTRQMIYKELRFMRFKTIIDCHCWPLVSRKKDSTWIQFLYFLWKNFE